MSKKNGMKQVALTSFLIGLNSMVFADDEVSSLSEIALNEDFSHAEIAASDDSYKSKKNNKNTSTEKKNQKICHSLGDKHPPYNNPNRFLFQGSFIYWQADVDGLDYSLEVNNDIFTPSIVNSKPSAILAKQSFKQKDLDFKWDPGFKAAVGVIVGDRDEWDLILRWTWLHSKASLSQNTGPAPDLSIFSSPVVGEFDLSFQVPTSPNLVGTPASFSHTSWKLLYNTIDLELGRNFFLANNLTLRTHLGLRGAFLHQHTKVNYDIAAIGQTINAGNGQLSPNTNIGTSFFKGRNEYDGIGIRGGLDTRWNFFEHFCAFGGISAAILYGQFEIDEDFLINSTLTNGNTLVDFASDFNVHIHRTRSTLQAELGLMWHTDFNNDKQHLSIGASYEVNQWFQQNELRDIDNFSITFKSSRSPGDLGLHGVTVDVVFDF